ncbi:MAG: hypothetical protein LBD08_07125 [Treponema sp.]|nr:hypothetical protein [Treponema sp.]
MRRTIQAMNGEKTIPGLLQKAYDSLKASDLKSALWAAEEALKADFEHPEVLYALTCVNWWLERMRRLPEIKESYDRGGYLLTQWKAFYGFLDRLGEGYEPCLYAVRCYVFSTALRCFEDVLGDGVNQHDPGLLLQAGKCYKGVGNYDAALKYLEQAARFKREDGETLSELADVNALLGDARRAKGLFREAFYADPQGVDLRSLDCEMIIRLAKAVAAEGKTGQELLEWMPVYGDIFKLFNIKRELKPAEVGRLKQSIFTLENEVRSRPENVDLLKPRLINRYFWQIDHYENAREDPGIIEEILLKIKILDPAIYTRYIR